MPAVFALLATVVRLVHAVSLLVFSMSPATFRAVSDEPVVTDSLGAPSVSKIMALRTVPARSGSEVRLLGSIPNWYRAAAFIAEARCVPVLEEFFRHSTAFTSVLLALIV